jgi:hypothetical protein
MTAGIFGLIVIGLILFLAYMEKKWKAKKIRRSAAASKGAYHPTGLPTPTVLPYRHAEGSGYGYDEKSDADEDA